MKNKLFVGILLSTAFFVGCSNAGDPDILPSNTSQPSEVETEESVESAASTAAESEKAATDTDSIYQVKGTIRLLPPEAVFGISESAGFYGRSDVDNAKEEYLKATEGNRPELLRVFVFSEEQDIKGKDEIGMITVLRQIAFVLPPELVEDQWKDQTLTLDVDPAMVTFPTGKASIQGVAGLIEFRPAQ